MLCINWKNIYHIDSPENYHIIAETNWRGKRTKETPMKFGREIYISSDSYYTLKKIKANGIVEPDILLVWEKKPCIIVQGFLADKRALY